MKTLLILRHAKATHHLPVGDFDRPLTERGECDAGEVGRWLKKHDLVPDLVVSSSAVRARATAATAVEECGYEGQIELKAELYLAEPEVLVEAVRRLPAHAGRVLIVGHNPGLEQLVYRLTGESHSLGTASLAWVEVVVYRWSAVGNGNDLKTIYHV